MKSLLIGLLCSLTLSCFAQDSSDDLDEVITLFVAAKTTGACGVIQQMMTFQESTKMAGGDEFIARFINTEMARLNITLPDFLRDCQTAIKKYNITMEELGFKQ